MIGDIAVPVKSRDVSISFDQSFRHFRAPVAASNDDSTALVPSVKTRPLATSGVENGPFAMAAAYLFFVNADPYLADQIGLPDASSKALITSSGSVRLCTKARPSSTTGEE